jgi:hypothetical protein
MMVANVTVRPRDKADGVERIRFLIFQTPVATSVAR